jgi:hypothetical protein
LVGLGDADGDGEAEGVGQGAADGDGDTEGEADVDGEREGEGDGEGEVEVVGDADGDGDTHTSRGDELVFDGGMTIGPGPWLAKYRASGTTTMPTITVRMKVTAPHSRRTKAQLTRREF